MKEGVCEERGGRGEGWRVEGGDGREGVKRNTIMMKMVQCCS